MMRQVDHYANCLFSISLWGNYTDNDEYIVFVYWDEETESAHEAYNIEGDLREAFKTYESMIEILKKR